MLAGIVLYFPAEIPDLVTLRRDFSAGENQRMFNTIQIFSALVAAMTAICPVSQQTSIKTVRLAGWGARPVVGTQPQGY